MLAQQTWFDNLDHRQTEQLREMAKERLAEKTAYFASRMGLTYQKITITSAKSDWAPAAPTERFVILCICFCIRMRR